MTKLRPYLLAVLSGVLYFLGFVGFDIWPLIFFFLAALLFAIDGVSPKKAFLLGEISGTVAMFGGYYWVNHLLREFANLNVGLAFLGYLLLALYHGLSVAIAAWSITSATRRFSSPSWPGPFAPGTT